MEIFMGPSYSVWDYTYLGNQTFQFLFQAELGDGKYLPDLVHCHPYCKMMQNYKVVNEIFMRCFRELKYLAYFNNLGRIFHEVGTSRLTNWYFFYKIIIVVIKFDRNFHRRTRYVQNY